MAQVTLERARLSADSVEHHFPDHSLDTTHVANFRHSSPEGAQRNALKVVRGKLDANGAPYAQNLIIEISTRRPIGYTNAEIATELRNAAALIEDSEIRADLDAGRLPDSDTLVFDDGTV
jgi:hypothetical protein